MDEALRGAFIALFCGLSVIRLVYRVTTGHLAGGLTPGSDQGWLFALRVLFSIPLAASMVIYIGFRKWAPWLALYLPPWLRWCGVAGGALALAMLLWAHRSLGPNFSPNVDLRPDHQLIRQGIYRWMRHPIYAAYALLFICATLISGNWLIGVSGLGIIAPLMTVRLRREELLLRQHFGQAYADYVQTTPRFLPAAWSKRRD